MSEELYDQLMECLIHLKNSKAATTNAYHRREWGNKMVHHTAMSTASLSVKDTKLNVQVKRSRRLHKVKKFVSKKLKGSSEKKLKEGQDLMHLMMYAHYTNAPYPDTASDGASIHSGSSDAERLAGSIQTMMVNIVAIQCVLSTANYTYTEGA